MSVAMVLMAVAASAVRGPESTLAPSLDRFFDSGAKSDAELTAVATALLDKADAEVAAEVEEGDAADAETVAAVETSAKARSDSDLDAEAEAEGEAELASESAAEVEAELDAEREDPLKRSPDATRLSVRQLAARRRARALRRARRAALLAAGKLPVGAAQSKAAAATASTADEADRDGVVRLVYDELKRLGASGSVAVPGPNAPPSPLGVVDPRVRSLEGRLSTFEKRRAEAANREQDKAISSINDRLAGLDNTLRALKNSALQQQKLTDQLMSAVAVARGGAESDSRPDFSVEYERAKLPGDFEARVEEILDSVKDQARKIYERFCKRRPRKVPSTDPNGTPKKYPKENTPPLPPVKGAKGKAGAAAAHAGAGAKGHAGAAAGKAGARAKGRAAPAPPSPFAAESSPASASASAKPSLTVSSGGGLDNEENPIPANEVVPKPILFAPIVKGKEPTPEGLRLAKALRDVSKALPLTPAYLLGANQRALQDTLGESAVSARHRK